MSCHNYVNSHLLENKIEIEEMEKADDNNICHVSPFTGTHEPTTIPWDSIGVREQYYPSTEPSQKIKFRYNWDPTWNLPQIATHILGCLMSGHHPSADIQIYFLASVLRDKSYTPTKTGYVGSFNFQKGVSVKSDLFIEFIEVKIHADDKFEQGDPDISGKYLGIAAWILVQIRLWKCLGVPNKIPYGYKIIGELRQLSTESPFNLTVEEVSHFRITIESYSSTENNQKIKTLAALFDYFALLDHQKESMRIRFATMTTRNEDHAALMYIDKLRRFLPISIDDFQKCVVTTECRIQLDRILKSGQGLENEYSLTPYSRSMNLVRTSMYSAKMNPTISTLAATVLGIMSTSTYLYFRKVPRDVDAEITLGIKIAENIGSRHPDSIDNIMQRIRTEMKTQGERPTLAERDIIKEVLNKIPPRYGTLRNYIETMSCFVPPQ